MVALHRRSDPLTNSALTVSWLERIGPTISANPKLHSRKHASGHILHCYSVSAPLIAPVGALVVAPSASCSAPAAVTAPSSAADKCLPLMSLTQESLRSTSK